MANIKPLSLEEIDWACTRYYEAARNFRAHDTSDKNDRVMDAALAGFTPKELREILYQIADCVELEALRQILPSPERHQLGFTLPPLSEVTSADQAEELAKDWQNWEAEQSQSYGELAADQAYFSELAKKYGLTEIFQENGII